MEKATLTMIYLIATLHIKPGSMDAIYEAVMPCIEATREEEGCISYDLHRSITSENKLVFVEAWRDRAALDAHFKEPHLAAWRAAGSPYFESVQIEIIDPAGVEVL